MKTDAGNQRRAEIAVQRLRARRGSCTAFCRGRWRGAAARRRRRRAATRPACTQRRRSRSKEVEAAEEIVGVAVRQVAPDEHPAEGTAVVFAGQDRAARWPAPRRRAAPLRALSPASTVSTAGFGPSVRGRINVACNSKPGSISSRSVCRMESAERVSASTDNLTMRGGRLTLAAGVPSG